MQRLSDTDQALHVLHGKLLRGNELGG